MAKPRPKFKVGETVRDMHDGRDRVIDLRRYDPYGWEYHLKGDPHIMFSFEEVLQARTPSKEGEDGQD